MRPRDQRRNTLSRSVPPRSFTVCKLLSSVLALCVLFAADAGGILSFFAPARVVVLRPRDQRRNTLSRSVPPRSFTVCKLPSSVLALRALLAADAGDFELFCATRFKPCLNLFLFFE